MTERTSPAQPHVPAPAGPPPRRTRIVWVVVGGLAGLLAGLLGITTSGVPDGPGVMPPQHQITVSAFGLPVHQERIASESYSGGVWEWGLTGAFVVIGAVVAAVTVSVLTRGRRRPQLRAE
jgi:hypothetical protein